MGGKTFSFVLIIVLVFLTLAIAMLAGYVFFVGNKTTDGKTTNENVEVTKSVPTDDELVAVELSEDKTYYNLKSMDPNKISVIEIQVELRYFKVVEGIKDVAGKIELYKSEIKEVISSYFSNLTLEDVKNVEETKKKAKEELTKKINEVLNANEKDKKDILYTIVFGSWFYQ